MLGYTKQVTLGFSDLLVLFGTLIDSLHNVCAMIDTAV